MIYSRETLAQLCREQQDNQCKVVFTNGCFDILHRGHVTYLQAARKLGDFLVLGLNSDASVQRLKGPTRPINSAEDRAYVLAGLRSIDYVTVFDEDTPLELIQLLQPDVLVKGGDYKEEDIVGADIVKSHGGIVQTIPFVPGKSTSNTIQAINAQQQSGS